MNPSAGYPSGISFFLCLILPLLKSSQSTVMYLLGYPPYPASATAYPPATPYPLYPPSVGGQGPTPYPAYPTGYPPYPAAPTGSGYPPYPPSSATTNPSSTGTISEDHIRASLLSAVEDKVVFAA